MEGEGVQEAGQTEQAGCLESTEMTERPTSRDGDLCVAEITS